IRVGRTSNRRRAAFRKGTSRCSKPGKEARRCRDRSNIRQQLFPKPDARAFMLEAARCAPAWSLVSLYFVSFGGFLALTAWLPVYWSIYYRFSSTLPRTLTALFSLRPSASRVVGGFCADRIGGRRTRRMAFYAVLGGSLVMAFASHVAVSTLAELVMAI